MKTVYFVRHGESEANAGLAWGDGASPLSDVGKEQAKVVAQRIAKLPVDLVISSSMPRAKETAKIIAHRLGKQVEYSDFFVERRHPSSQYGKVRTNPDILKVSREIRENFHVPGYRHSDEENFDDFRTRALACLKYLTERNEQNLLVVTHGFFLRILIATAMFGDHMSGEVCESMIRALRMDNTGITVIRLRDTLSDVITGEQASAWELQIWNDHAHLG